MLTTIVSKAAAPHLAWGARAPGLAAIVAQALRSGNQAPRSASKASRGYRYPKPQPAPFTWL